MVNMSTTIVNMSNSVRRSPTRPNPAGWPLVAAWIGLLFILGSVLGTYGIGVGDALLLTAAFASVLLQLTRLSRAPHVIMAWSLAFCVVYLVVSPFTTYSTQGIQHFFTAVTATGALLLFANFGQEITAYRWFRISSYALSFVGVLGAHVGGLAKNGTGAATLYLVALLTIVLLTQAKRGEALYVVGFFIVTGALAFTLDLRGMVGYAAVLVIGFVGAATLPKTAFWIAGIIGSLVVILTTLWYFLNIYTSQLAHDISTTIVSISGRPATSGREWIWPAIVDAVSANGPWFGLGPGALPRDILPTTLSSHNFYLQIYLQLGFAGIILLTGFLLAVWRPLAFARSTVGYFGAAIFLMFVTHNATEVIMLQNALIASVPAWCAIGIAIAFANTGVTPPKPSRIASRRTLVR
tara:strand:- start:4809 stop:6035 length:1227 start_codon:yes stop_codon:yes gene_type:complete